MNDIKKVLIVAISVVLVIAIVAGVSIGVMANTMNGLKDQVSELEQAYESEIAEMKTEIEAAKNSGEDLVTAADFEAKLAAALGDQTQTMQSLINAAVKNQIEALETEGLTEAQVNEIINAAVANCLTEDEINAIIADSNSGLTEAEVKKLINNANAGFLTYAQIVNLIDDNNYDLRMYLEAKIGEVADDLGNLTDNVNSQVSSLTGLLNALADESISEIVLTADIATTERIEIKRDVFLNLNGHTISRTDEGTGVVANTNWTLDPVIAIQDATVTITGDGAVTANNQACVALENNAKVIIENGTFTSKVAPVYVWSYCTCYGNENYSNIKNAEVVINDGEFICTARGFGAVYVQGDTSKATINGGSFKSTAAATEQTFAVLIHGGNVTINDGKFESNWAVTNVNTSGLLTINGGEFKTDFACNSTHKDILYACDNAKVVVSGGKFHGQNPSTHKCVARNGVFETTVEFEATEEGSGIYVPKN